MISLWLAHQAIVTCVFFIQTISNNYFILLDHICDNSFLKIVYINSTYLAFVYMVSIESVQKWLFEERWSTRRHRNIASSASRRSFPGSNEHSRYPCPIPAGGPYALAHFLALTNQLGCATSPTQGMHCTVMQNWTFYKCIQCTFLLVLL